jgi:hypothetical protein
MFSLGHFHFNDLSEPAILAKTRETSLAESGRGHQVIRGVLRSCCAVRPIVLQLKPLWATGQTIQSGVMTWPSNHHGAATTAKEDGMSESLASGDMSVNCKPECRAAAKGDGIVRSNVDRK